MLQIERKDIRFDSADGQNQIAGYLYTHPEVKPHLVLQISHGMCEHIERYEDFAGFLAKNGIAVCGNDHLGHGSSVKTEEDFGFFTKKGGYEFVLQDLKTMNGIIHNHFPGLPVVLLGHSMGSFYARQYAVQWPESIDGLIISGTGGPNPATAIGKNMAALISKTQGERHRSSMLYNLAFGTYLKKIENPRTPYDWISRDTDIVDIYAADPRCTFRFTANGYHELLSILQKVSSPDWAVGIRKDMPVLMISGDADPVGGYGKGVETVRDWLKGAGVKNLTFKLYPGARHEVLNETNREEVYNDVLAFLNQWWKASVQ